MRLNKKFDYTWVIVFACFLLGFFCLGFCSGNKSLYLAAITEAQGLKRSLFSINDSVRYLTTAAVNLFFGSLLHKLGVRKMVAMGILSLVLSCVVNATANTIWGFYAGGALLGLGLALCTTTMISFIIRRWCKRNTGKILGFTLAANGIGASVGAQLVSPIIYRQNELFGYRDAYLLTAGILVAVGLTVVPLLREQPKKGPVQQEVKKEKSRAWEGMDYAQVKKMPYFYIAAVCIFLTGMSLQGLSGISAAHMKDAGIHADTVATVVSVQSLGLAASKFLVGVGYDKFGLRVTMTVCDVAAVAATVLLTLVGATALGVNLAFTHALFTALAMPLETIMLSLFAAELFGNRAFPQTMGVFAAVNTAGYAAGTPIANWCYGTFGSYVPVILSYAAIMLAVTVVFQLVVSAAVRQRKKLVEV